MVLSKLKAKLGATLSRAARVVLAVFLVVSSIAGAAGAAAADSGTPNVETLHAADVAETEAKIYGKVHDWGNHSGGQFGFQYRVEGADEWHTILIGSATTSTRYAYQFESLLSGMTYEYRAMVEADGVRYTGETKTFTTESSDDGGSGDDGSDDGGEEGEDDEEGGGLVQPIVDAIEELETKMGATMEEVLISVLFKPFLTLAQLLVKYVTLLLTHTPDVYPNPAVEDVHQRVLLVVFAMSGLGFIATGFLYMVGPILGVTYRQARMILPRLFIALAFSAVSLPLLQLMVDFTNALTIAFAPSDVAMTETEFLGVTAQLVIVWFVKAILLLVFVVMFIVRDVYILFLAAISPLLAFAWVFPRTKRYADSFIAGWFTALAMAPLDALVLRFNLALLEASGSTPLQHLSNWVFGVAALVLLIWVPYQLYGASQAAVAQAYLVAHGAKNRVSQYKQKQRREHQMEDRRKRWKKRQQALESIANSRQRGGRRSTDENKFSEYVDDSYQNDGGR